MDEDKKIDKGLIGADNNQFRVTICGKSLARG